MWSGHTHSSASGRAIMSARVECHNYVCILIVITYQSVWAGCSHHTCNYCLLQMRVRIILVQIILVQPSCVRTVVAALESVHMLHYKLFNTQVRQVGIFDRQCRVTGYER